MGAIVCHTGITASMKGMDFSDIHELIRVVAFKHGLEGTSGGYSLQKKY